MNNDSNSNNNDNKNNKNTDKLTFRTKLLKKHDVIFTAFSLVIVEFNIYFFCYFISLLFFFLV